jgi:hypothetical protein
MRGSVGRLSKNGSRLLKLVTVASDAERCQIGRVERSATLLEAANVMDLKRTASTAPRAGVAVTCDNCDPHLLPLSRPPQHPRWLGVALLLSLPLAVGTRAGRRILFDPRADGT